MQIIVTSYQFANICVHSWLTDFYRLKEYQMKKTTIALSSAATLFG